MKLELRATLIGLGLNKMHKVSELEDTPEVRGMIRKLPHMVTIVINRRSTNRRPSSRT